MKWYLLSIYFLLSYNAASGQYYGTARKWSIEQCFQYATENNIQMSTLRLDRLSSVQDFSAAKMVTIFLLWQTLVSQFSVVLSFLVCSVTGVFFGYYPALKATKLDTIEALPYE